jgi:hypothetical protein
MTDPVDRGRNRSETFAEFARAEGFSLSTFYKLKKLGLGPDVLRVPGTRIERITPEARQAWRERMPSWQRAKPHKWKQSAGAPKPPKPENSPLKARTT